MMKILVAFLVFFSFADEQHQAQHAKRTRIPTSVTLQDSPVFKGREQVKFAITKDGKTPEKLAFNKNWRQRRLAALAKSYVGDTSAKPGIVVKFESMELMVDPKDENKFFVVIRTMGRQAILKPSVDRALLESGELVTLREHKVKDVMSVGQVTADFVAQLKFNPETGKLSLPYVSGSVAVSTLISEEADSVEIKNLDCEEISDKQK